MKASVPAAFFDLAMTVVFVFMAWLLLSTFSDPKPSAGIIMPKAEFLITLDWDDNSPDDIDLYVRDPLGQIVFFQKRRTASMFLDNDNMGQNNTITAPDGSTETLPGRREIVTIRKTTPGEYVVNAHAFRKAKGSPPAHVRLTIVKVNPYQVVTVAHGILVEERDEITLANFTLDSEGTVTGLYVVPVRMVGG